MKAYLVKFLIFIFLMCGANIKPKAQNSDIIKSHQIYVGITGTFVPKATLQEYSKYFGVNIDFGYRMRFNNFFVQPILYTLYTHSLDHPVWLGGTAPKYLYQLGLGGTIELGINLMESNASVIDLHTGLGYEYALVIRYNDGGIKNGLEDFKRANLYWKIGPTINFKNVTVSLNYNVALLDGYHFHSKTEPLEYDFGYNTVFCTKYRHPNFFSLSIGHYF